MGLLSRSTNFVRYAVEGGLPEKFWDFAAEHIARYSFRDIDDTFEEYFIGWVAVDNMFDSSFAGASYAVGDYVVLAMRIDERRVSPTLLQKYCRKEEERLKKEKQLPRLSRSQRVAIREDVRLQLVKKSMPAASVYDLCWNLAESTLIFFSTNPKAQSALEDFFRECFGLTIILQVPYVAAGHLLGPREEERLQNLRPEILV